MEITDNQLVISLNSRTCPACGNKKERAQSFCKACYFKLPPKVRMAMYDRLGEGYYEAMDWALQLLHRDEFKMPPEETAK